MRFRFPFASVLFAAGFVLAGCTSFHSAPPPQPNVLSRSEAKAGWKMLFDGQTLNGWHRFGTKEAPKPGWYVENGCLKLKPHSGAGDIVTADKFDNFELQWDWRIPPNANNGIKYFVVESRPHTPGPEYQMIDDAAKDAQSPKHKTATLYDILTTMPDKPLHPPGEWNTSRLVVKGNQVEHWLNGKKVVSYEAGSPELKAAIAQSKFRNIPDFDKKEVGPILLTDHQDECWFRNIKIREIR